MGTERMKSMSKAPELLDRNDRIAPYLKEVASSFLFDAFSEDYLRREGLDFMIGVPIPLNKEDLAAFAEGGLPVVRLADNMALLCGADPQFPSAGSYLRFLARFFDEKLADVLTDMGGRHLRDADYARSAAYFRSALLLESIHQKALFGYACACREWYLSLEGEEDHARTQALKDESTEFFEWCQTLYPDFGAAYYFLGYAYLNLGLYTKAKLTWERFLALASDGEEKQEIEERLTQLKDPVRIEEGINLLLGGKLREGLAILEPYVQSDYRNWWPLHYYLASAYRALNYLDEALEGFHKVLELSPSHIDSIRQLSELYAQKNDSEKAEKYRRKAELLEIDRED